MGISCDLEVGSMDSEAKPSCNSESLKRNGRQDACNAVAEATTPKTPLTIVVDTIDASNSTSVIDLVSPTSKEAEPILIGDDAEPEEGEIINTDSEFEYEAISSDEEFTLRQQIEALEAKNRELEKIASISSRTIDYDYISDYHRPSIYSNYKIPLATNRSNITKTNAPLSSSASNFKPLPLSHVECISSDEAQIVDSGNEMPYVFDGGSSSGKFHGRSHRSAASSSSAKKEKRQSRRNKSRNGGIESGGDKERCSLHGKRRCTDLACEIVEVATRTKKRVRHKYDGDRKTVKSKYSSDSEDELLRNRAELKMALNIIEPSARTMNTTLSHKLSAIQNHQQQQHTLDDGKKSTVSKHRKRKCSHSPDRDTNNKRSKHTKPLNSKTEIDRSKSEQIKIKSNKSSTAKKDKQQIENASTASTEAAAVHDDEDDEQISLEEQELRLIALKSAVLKKHEARKRKQLAIVQACEQVVRPYSPTDSIVLVADETAEPGESGEQRCSNDCQIDSDSNNMDISPISSPTNQYQPMDMDLVSSNENSKSPVFSYEKPQTFPPFDPFIDWATVHIPVPINAAAAADAAAAAAAYVDIADQTACALNSQFTLQPSYSLIYDANLSKEPISVANPIVAIQSDAKENEPNDSEADELRAKLIEQMRATNTLLPNEIIESNCDAKPMQPTNEDNNNTRDGRFGAQKEAATINVDSLEEDCLRSLLLSSKGKKSNILKETTNEPLENPMKTNKIAEPKSCDDIPKLTLNLREALKRLKSNQQNKLAANSSSKKMLPSSSSDESNRFDKTHEDENANNRVKSLHNCDHYNEIQKTVVNEHIGNDEESEQKSTGLQLVTSSVDVPSTQVKKMVECANKTKMDVDIVTNVPTPASASTAAPAKPLDVVKQKPAPDVSKGIHVSAVSKTTEELVHKKEPPITKKITSQSTVKTAAMPRPKQTSTIVNEPASTAVTVVPLRSKSVTPPTVSKMVVNASGTVAAATALTLNKMESIRRSSASPIIATWTAKPVKKLIISLNEDSSTDTDDTECSTIKKTDITNTNEPISNTFQVRLDQFLQTVRANTSVIPEKMPQMPKSTDKKDSPQKNQITSSKLESSKAVAHLPISSQLEYHRLLNRMKLLEKQKEQKSRLKNQHQQPTLPPTHANAVPVTAVESNFPSLTVVVQNENRIIQTNKVRPPMDDSDKKPSDVMKMTNNKNPLIASNVSLAKKVLVKNAMDSLNTPNVTNELEFTTDNFAKLEVNNEPKPKQTITTTADDRGVATKPKPTAMSLAMFAKKTPKVRATVLANYVKKYRNQGEQYLCGLAKLYRLTSRTNLETRKQQKLEQALDELRRQTKIIEEKFAQQKTITQSLYPAMAAAEKAASADRVTMQRLENCCNRLGNIVNGADYKIQSDKETEIKNKIIQITIEKNKLKLLTKITTAPVISQLPKNVASKLSSKLPTSAPSISSLPKQQSKIKPNATATVQLQSIPNQSMSQQADVTSENERKIEPEKCEPIENPSDCTKVDTLNQIDEKSICNTNSTIDCKELIDGKPVATTSKQKESNAYETNLNESIRIENNIKSNENQSINTEMENEQIIQSNDNNNQQPIVDNVDIVKPPENVIESDQKVDDKSLSTDNLTEKVTANNAIEDSDTQYGKYDSPLDHLENCVETQPSEASDVDRNAILCPYDLMGRCEDKQCKYKHIKM